MKLLNILLIQPMHEKTTDAERSSFNFPWGLSVLSALYQKAGVKVTILDGQVLQLRKEKLLTEIDKYDFDIAGISAFSTQYPAVKLFSEHIKKNRKVPVIVGGPLATYQAELCLKTCDVDVCVIGPGEISGIEILKHWDDLGRVDGIVFKKNNELIFTNQQRKFFNLDETPMPDFSLFDIKQYLSQDNAYARKSHTGGYNSMTFVTTRGCPYNCYFCSKSIKGFASMSPIKIYNMLSALKSELNLEEISMGDELFLSSKSKFREMAPLLKKLKLRWGGQARVNLVDKEFLDMIKNSGCIGLGYGIESGSQKILDNMNKKTTVKQIEFAMKYTQALKIPVKVQLIFGYPGEDEETLNETIDLFKRVDHPGRRFNVITPVPGSKLYDDCIREGRIRDEVDYLYAIEKNFGIPKIHVNFTKWPDNEIYPRKERAEKKMYLNYINNSSFRKNAFRAKRLAKKVMPKRIRKAQ